MLSDLVKTILTAILAISIVTDAIDATGDAVESVGMQQAATRVAIAIVVRMSVRQWRQSRSRRKHGQKQRRSTSAVSMKQLCPSKRSRVAGSSAGDTDSSMQVLCISRGQREEGKAGEGYELCGKRSRRKTEQRL